jgi:hypothetical protein
MAGRYAFFATDGHQGDGDEFDSRYSSAVAAVIARAYPVERHLAGYTLHFPAAPLPSYAAGLR